MEERKREAQRRLEQERALRAAAAAESSAALADGNKLDVDAKQVVVQTDHKNHHERVSSMSSIDRLFPFDKEARSSEVDTSEAPPSESVVPNGGTATASSSVAGRVSRLSAMFEQS